MERSQRVPTMLAALMILSCPAGVKAIDVYGKQFDPPRVYFTHANLNKNGDLTAIKGQDNFLSLYVPGIDRGKAGYEADGFTYAVHLPGFVRMLDAEPMKLKLSPITQDGRHFTKVEGTLDPEGIKNRCFRGFWGLDLTLWYRVDEAPAGIEPQPAWVTLFYRGQKTFLSTARLRVHEALKMPPRIDPKDFRFWLHYGPHYRAGHWDELADYLGKAGFNAIQYTLGGPDEQAKEKIGQMKKRGFYAIAQRGGSPGEPLGQMQKVLTEGPAWFEKADAGCMQHYLPMADAALWDFEPSPLHLATDPWTLGEFRKAAGLGVQEELTEETIKSKYIKQWVDFRQNQLAMCVKHWADYCRSVNPAAETILTEGRANVFDPPGQIDYAKCGRYVTLCDPMNATGAASLLNVRKWMAHAPQARFNGCQNVALSGHHQVFISAQSTMLQLVGSALIGTRGTDIYPGPAMDAEEFALLNRGAWFLGRNRAFIFKGRRSPSSVTVELLPREVTLVNLGDGRTIRNAHPDWNVEGIGRTFAKSSGDEYLAAIENLSDKEPCYARLTAAVSDGTYRILDDDNQQAFTLAGKAEIPAASLTAGVYVTCPPGDFRAFRLGPASAAAPEGYKPVALELIQQAYRQYAKVRQGAAAQDRGEQTRPAEADRSLIFHLDFENGPDASVSKGVGTPTVTGNLTYEKTPQGSRAAVVGKGVSLSYPPEGNVDLQRGKIYMHFKPLWHGSTAKRTSSSASAPRPG